MTFPAFTFPYLPPNTIVPKPSNEDLFIPYLNRLYEEIALIMNQKDFKFYTIPVGTTAVPIPNIDTFGAYTICVNGVSDGMPSAVYACSKSNSTIAGNAVSLASQNGTTIGSDATWNGVAITIASSATNFTIVHNAATGTIGNFNIKYIGTS